MLFTGKVGIDQMMGPVGISSVVSQTTGFVDFIYMLAIISISLGVTNLLPIPALDGGHLVQFMIEFIIRRDIPEKILYKVQYAGLFVLLSIFVIAFINDITKYFTFLEKFLL